MHLTQLTLENEDLSIVKFHIGYHDEDNSIDLASEKFFS